MSFLSATLLLGTLAAGVPIALHFLARQPPRRVVFPAVSFLRQRLTTQSSRLRVRRLWLLVLRILALVAFAIVLAQPHIDAAMSSQWISTGMLLVAGAVLLVMASVAFSRGLARSLAWSLLAVAIVLASIGGIVAVRAIASGTSPRIAGDGPMAIAILIDNSPSSAWRIDDDFTSTAGNTQAVAENSEELREQAGLDLAGTRLALALAWASDLIDSLPSGSRVAIVDRSGSPAGFSLDPRAAQARLDRITPHAVPAPIAERIVAAVDLVGTSDLPQHQVVVISDMSAPTWETNAPASNTRSPLAAAQHEGVPIRILSTHEQGELELESEGNRQADSAGRPVADADTFNSWISPPQVAEVAPSPETAIPIRFEVGAWPASAMAAAPLPDSGADGTSTKAFTATVQLSLYDQNPALPVVRDGRIVFPQRRTVDRASVALSGGAAKEVSLTLPPLTRGTHHAVVELLGGDRFQWDNLRFITVDIPASPRVLVVGEDRNETSVLAAAMTAPHAPDSASASYNIETVSYRDLAAVDWTVFNLVVLIDPPLHFDAGRREIVGSSNGISTAMWNDIAGVVSRGGGLMISLGPAAEVIGMASSGGDLGQAARSTEPLAPPLIRSWRVPAPGTFWQVTNNTHPIFSTLMRPTSMPNWSDFRIQRYWQVAEATSGNAASMQQPSREGESTGQNSAGQGSAWDVIARYAKPNDQAGGGHPAVLIRRLGEGRVALTTTPLPALGRSTRDWNDLFGAADAWPAFMAVRGLAAWAAGLHHEDTTVLAGQPVLRHLEWGTGDGRGNTDGNSDGSGVQDEPVVELYQPGQASGRTLPATESHVLIQDTDTPGTYFLRGPRLWSGLSVNLPPVWSAGETTDQETLQRWFGDQDWSMDHDLGELSLRTGGQAGAAVSLHGPLMLMVVLVFLAEQILSNRFYGSSSDRESD
ncbi:BatA domain-containing protein [Allorhodopirellula solitaria]|uniref:Aerotolerance regulator N-terminal domain-containing protein n=1 Tax=Allorhodopirellula solitaria TaxID=2527987 RepID=A0A5C5XQC9_9BACT|nr:BatA domain-containing protein [Allorhodopirellula solitaria]TWT64799.1 hypothetical protein CA85_35840 [Allorhodopirellula solitaria]